MIFLLFWSIIISNTLALTQKYSLIFRRYTNIEGRYNALKISDIRIRLINKETTRIKAIASITIEDCFVVHDIKVLENDHGLFIAMPSKRTLDGDFKDIVHPLNTETRVLISSLIITAYNEAKAKANNEEIINPA